MQGTAAPPWHRGEAAVPCCLTEPGQTQVLDRSAGSMSPSRSSSAAYLTCACQLLAASTITAALETAWQVIQRHHRIGYKFLTVWSDSACQIGSGRVYQV
jgi:hypothetical protein